MARPGPPVGVLGAAFLEDVGGEAGVGVKRVCQSCAVKFYDLNRAPITCPKCAAPFDPEALLKSRRSRPAPLAKAAKPKAADDGYLAAEKPPEDDAKNDKDSGESAGRLDDDENNDSVLQDTSELGDDGVSEVAVTSEDDG